MQNQLLSVLATADTSSIRVETYAGTEYLVVPIVALVEGVLQGANAAGPELALASEFGRFPEGWNGRPVVMGHPKVNGNFVSANSQPVLSQWAYGALYNTLLDGTKLKTECWINLESVNEAKSDDGSIAEQIVNTVERVQNGELVEVSTGLFSVIEPMHGVFNGDRYEGIWRNCVPDHLALLAEGDIGACSVEDGCGAPRLNQREGAPAYRVHCSGGTCTCGGNNVPDNQNTNTDGIDRSPEAIQARRNERLDHLASNAYPTDMPDTAVRTLLRQALENDPGVDLYTVYTFTQDVVVYETWQSLKLYQRGYDISSNGVVTLDEEISEVVLLARIHPVTAQGEGDNNEPANNNGTTDQDNQEGNMTQNTDTDAQNASGADAGGEGNQVQANADTGANTGGNAGEGGDGGNAGNGVAGTSGVAADLQDVVTAAATQASADAAAIAAQNQPTTLEQHIANMPPELQEVMNESLRLHNRRKETLVSALRANDRCDFSEAELQGMKVQELERLAKLANVPTYAGAAPATSPTANSESENAPAPMVAFPVNNGESDGAQANGQNGQPVYASRAVTAASLRRAG